MTLTGLLLEALDGRCRALVLPGRPVVLGRRPPIAPQNVRVPSKTVSRSHALIQGDAQGFTVEDAGSTSGIYINHMRLCGPTPIGPGTRIQLTSDAIFAARPFVGESLWDILRRGAPLSLRESLQMAIDVLRAFLPLHAAGEAHGGLSPHEIVRESGPSPTSGSFTLLIQGWRAVDDDGRVNQNPAYVAPETLREGRIEAATDVYALALILFESLSGRRPFSIDSPLVNIMAKARGELPTCDPEWPGALREWIHRALSVEPSERPRAAPSIELLEVIRSERTRLSAVG